MNKLFILSTIIAVISLYDASAMEQNRNNCLLQSEGKFFRLKKYTRGPYKLKLQETNPDVRRALESQFEDNKNNDTEFPFPTHKNL